MKGIKTGGRATLRINEMSWIVSCCGQVILTGMKSNGGYGYIYGAESKDFFTSILLDAGFKLDLLNVGILTGDQACRRDFLSGGDKNRTESSMMRKIVLVAMRFSIGVSFESEFFFLQ